MVGSVSLGRCEWNILAQLSSVGVVCELISVMCVSDRVDPYADGLRCVRQPGRPLDGCSRGRWCGCSWRWRCPHTPCGWRSSGGLATNTPPRCSRCWTCAGRSRCFACSARMESCQPSPHNSLCLWSSGNIPDEHTDTQEKQIGIMVTDF